MHDFIRTYYTFINMMGKSKTGFIGSTGYHSNRAAIPF
ncbi:hypothetical protein FM109_13510 [Vibrio casei]|nr:hypothetical protein FM109_13510 [Vibrio casei]